MLQLNNIQYQYKNGGSPFRVSVSNLNFKAGVVNAILGKNGSGKTTLLNLIGGHIFSENGSIQLCNIDITKQPATKRKVSTVFQTIALFPHLSVKENILIAIQPNSFRKPNQAITNKVNDLLNDFNLNQFTEERKPSELSIGQQQRVAIARAIATEPMALLLDEPTSALDFENIAYLKTLLKELIQKGKVPICIIVSHDLPFVLNIADEIKYIENGTLAFEGTSQDFKNSKYYIN